MTKRQRANFADQLRTALQVLFENQSVNRDAVSVELKGSKGPAHFWYAVKCPLNTKWDARKIAQEVEKILPNARVTEQLVFFYSRSITLIVKDLGKKGTYEIDLDDMRT